MKKKALVTLAVFLMMALSGASAMGSGPYTLWQIGTPDGAVNPILGADEYPATGAWTESFSYTVGSDSDPINHPSMPGYIGPKNVCDFAGGRPCTDTTASLDIQFSLACSYAAGDLTLIYDRYGSEADQLYLDGAPLATVSATESGFHGFTFSDELGALARGEHTLQIVYAGGGSGNGHYIDYLKLESSVACLDVEIDIKPGSYPNCFNVNDHGVIPVAINGSDVFDVTQVEIETLSFAGLTVRVKGNGTPQCSVQDWDGDGYSDLVCQFVDDADVWMPGDGYATLTGNLIDGTPFTGSDEICLRP